MHIGHGHGEASFSEIVVQQYIPPELHVHDAAVAELVVEAGLCQGAEGLAAEVEVVGSDGLVVHVGDEHRDRLARALGFFLASHLHEQCPTSCKAVSCCPCIHQAKRRHACFVVKQTADRVRC